MRRFSIVEAKKSGRSCHSLLCCRNGKGRKNNKKRKKLKNYLIQGELKLFQALLQSILRWEVLNCSQNHKFTPPSPFAPAQALLGPFNHCKSLLLCTQVWGHESCGNRRVRGWEGGGWMKLRSSPDTLSCVIRVECSWKQEEAVSKATRTSHMPDLYWFSSPSLQFEVRPVLSSEMPQFAESGTNSPKV